MYWSNADDDTLLRLAFRDSVPTTLAQRDAAVGSLAAGPAGLFWTEPTANRVMFLAASGGTPTAFGTAASPRVLAARAGHVYWADVAGDVLSAPARGGAPATIAFGQTNLRAIVVDNASVYWALGGLGPIVKAPLVGGAPVTLVYGADASDIALDAASVYWTVSIGGSTSTSTTIMKVPLGGGTTATLVESQPGAPGGIVVEGANVYWTEQLRGGGSVLSVGVDGGPVSVVASTGSYPAGITADAANVYWTVEDKTTGTVNRSALTGGPTTVLASGRFDPHAIAVDSGTIYWADADLSGSGSVLSVPTTGGAVATLATNQNAAPIAVAVDNTSVYWIDSGTGANALGNGTVMSVARSGGAPRVFAGDPTAIASIDPGSIAVSGTVAIWTFAGIGGGNAGGIARLPNLGAAPALLAAVVAPTALAADATNAYYGNADGTIATVGLDGSSPPVVLASGQSATSFLAVDSEAVYWIAATTNPDGTDTNTLLTVPKVGGTPLTLAAFDESPGGLAAVGGRIYWTTQGTSDSCFTDGSLHSVPVRGGAVAILAANLEGPVGPVAGGSDIYWVNGGLATGSDAGLPSAFGGSVMKWSP